MGKICKNGTCCTYGCSTVSDAVGNAYFATPFISATTTFDSFTITNKGNIDFAIAKIPAPMPTIPRNCSEILKQNPAAPSGVYTIDPDGAGALPSMSCNCDMTTDGGGWTLVLNYNRLSGTDPALNIFTNALPLQNNTTPGFDESNTPYWGHAGNALMNAIPFNELRFYGVTTNHNRVMNFKTNHAGTIAYIKTGLGSMNGIKSKFTPLSGHTSNLPASADSYYTNVGDNAMCAAPFYTNSTYHWNMKHGTGDGACSNIANRWEVDDFPCSLAPSTFHQIWVRQGATDPCVNVTCNISPGVYATNVLNTGCNNGTIKVKRGNGVYNFYPHIELYKDTNMVTFIDLSPGTAEYTFSNLIPGKYTVKVSDGLCCQSTFIRNIKCRAPSSGFQASNITASSAQLKWNVANCAEGYRVLYHKKGTTTWLNKGVNTNTGLLNLTGLQPQTTYEWRVGTKCNGWPEIMDILAYSSIQTFTTNALRPGEVITQSNANEETFEINIFPNPATYTLAVNFECESETANLKIVNMLGEVVMQKQVNAVEGIFETQMDIANLKSGMYMLKVETENGESRKVFVKE
ncbi:MAG: T9SS type A sorting domain-containing protein [Bacteroidetes bacterium]|nr:T9SS type A sorting domain-containing protein [Bacteroidota bacterium]